MKIYGIGLMFTTRDGPAISIPHHQHVQEPWWQRQTN